MSQPEASDLYFSKGIEGSMPLEEDLEIVRLSEARASVMDEAAAEIARQLNGSLTALLLYMGEIKQHSRQLSEAAGNRHYLQQVVENAFQQTTRVYDMIKRMAGAGEGPADARVGKVGWNNRTGYSRDIRAPDVKFSSRVGQKPLTKREREVLRLIGESYSNKQGALRMGISPRTFECHRAKAMRKLGARNTADLVRFALLDPAV